MSACARHRADERGTTIMEVLVSVLLLALLSGAIASLVTVVSKDQVASSDRLTASSAAHQLQHWFTADVQSADRSVLDDPLDPDQPCDGTDPGDRLRLAWADGATKHVALYRVEPVDDGAHLVRVECADTTVRTRSVVARDLDGTDAVVVGEDPDAPGSLRMTVAVRTRDGVRTLLLSEPLRLVDRSTVTSTSLQDASPPDPCTLRSLTVANVTMPGTATAKLTGSRLAVTVPIDLRTSGSCGTMALQVRRDTAVIATVPLAHEASTDPATYRDRYVADLPPGPWIAGTYSVLVTDTGAPITGITGTLVLRRPCWVSRLSARTAVAATIGGSKRLLSKDVVIEATVDEGCPELALTISPTPPTGVPALVLAAGSTTRTATIPSGTGPWSSGIYVVRITNVTDAPSTAFSVGTQPACQVTGLSVVPGTVLLRPGAAGTARGLRTGISVSIGTMGSCGAVTATVVGTSTVPAPGPYVVGVTPILIGADPQLAWWPGSYSVRLSSSVAVIVGASNEPFEVVEGCTATLTSGWSSKELSSTSSRPLAFTLITDTACDGLAGTVSPSPINGGVVSLSASSSTGVAVIDGSISKGAGWDKGSYTLTITSGGVPVASSDFTIS